MCAYQNNRSLRARGGAATASILASLFIAGCSTDVQRFGPTASLPSTAQTIAAPVAPVQSAPLNGTSDYTARPTYRASAPAPRQLAPAPIAQAPVAPAQQRFASGGSITVQSGDTAYSVARRHGCLLYTSDAADE